MGQTCPSNWSCILICIFIDPSEWFHMTNQGVRFWLIRTVVCGQIKLQIWIPHLHKNGPIKDQGGLILSLYKPGSPLSWWSALLISTRGCLSPVCKLWTCIKSLLLLNPDGELMLALIGGSGLLLTFLKWVSCRPHTIGFCFLIYSDNLSFNWSI